MAPLRIWPVVWLLFLHWLGDFKFQSNEMAQQKAKSWTTLLTHVWIYTMTVGIGMLVVAGPAGLLPLDRWLLWVVSNFWAHLVIDAVTSRMSAKLWFVDAHPRPLRDDNLGGGTPYAQSGQFPSFPFYARFFEEKRHWFFVVIGFDQWLHAASLLWSLSYFGG